jgi:tRNA A37 threonylcarbamoyladenosine synthetase subunit TsaC/SUA5/YrdC
MSRARLRRRERPITATSANLGRRAPTADPTVERTLGDRIDLLIDTGRTRRRAVDNRRPEIN